MQEQNSNMAEFFLQTHENNQSIMNFYSGPSNKITSRCTKGGGRWLMKWGPEQICSQMLTKGWQRWSKDHIVRQTVPNNGSRDWKGPVADGRQYTHTHPFDGPFPGLPRWAGTRKVKPIWILLKQETVSGSGIIWAICKSEPRSRQITTPTPHHSVFFRPDALPAAQLTASKHWRHYGRQ